MAPPPPPPPHPHPPHGSAAPTYHPHHASQQQPRMVPQLGYQHHHHQHHHPPPPPPPPRYAPPPPHPSATCQWQPQAQQPSNAAHQHKQHRIVYHHHSHHPSGRNSDNGAGAAQPSAAHPPTAHHSVVHYHPQMVPVQFVPAPPPHKHGYQMVATGVPSHHVRSAVPVATNHPSQNLGQPQPQTSFGVSASQDPRSISTTAAAPSSVEIHADQPHPNPTKYVAASAEASGPAFRSDPVKLPMLRAEATQKAPVRRITNWRRALPISAVATDNAIEAPTLNVTDGAASAAEEAIVTTEPQADLVSETALSNTAIENINNCITDTAQIPTRQQEKGHPPSAPEPTDASTKPPLPQVSDNQPTSNRKGGITSVIQSAMGFDRTQNTTANPKFMSPITMCFDRMLGAAAAIRTPAGAKSMFSKTPAAIGEKTSASETVSTKEGKRMPFLSKRKIHPVDVETVRSRSLSKGNVDPFQELAQDADLERLVILEMAKQRQTAGFNSLLKDSPHNRVGDDEGEDDPKRPISRIICEGFYWKDYPPCELVLYNHMMEYYEISAIKKDYKVQQEFNNILVDEVRQAAVEAGFEVDPNFDDKKLRDRIRCFFKTHLQNAKKRLATLQKHSDAPENQALVSVFIRMVRNPSLTYEDSLAMSSTGRGHDISGPGKKRRRLLQQHKTPSAAKTFSPSEHQLYHGEEDTVESDTPAQPQWNHRSEDGHWGTSD